MDEEDFFNCRKKETQIQQQLKEKKEQEERDLEEAKRKEEEQLKKRKSKKQHEEDESEVAKSEGPKSVKLSSKTKDGDKQALLSDKGQRKSAKALKAKDQPKPQDLVENEIGKSYFIVPDEVPMELNKELIETEDNKVRRWQVVINEIRLENLQKEVLSVFLNFRIGQLGKNAIKHKDVSSEEVFFKSEICKDLKRSEVKVIKVSFQCEMNVSYQMLKERYFIIEIWEYRRFRLNLFLGKITVSLLSIASGNIKRQDDIKKAFGEKRQFARIHYNILFQEIWDYKLTFEAWKGSNIIADKGGDYDPKIKLALMTDELIWPQVESEVVKKTKNPNFRNLKGYMHYRGSLEQLTQQMMKVTLYKDAYFMLAEKLVSLRGIQDTNYLKVQFRLKLKFPPPKPVGLKKSKKKKKTAKQRLQDGDDDDDEEQDDDALQDESHYALAEGRVNLNKTPRYQQNGELNVYIPEEYYLVVTVNRLNNVLSPDDRGVINSFLTVSWRDQAKSTRMIKNDPNPTYNEELYFRIPLLKRTLSIEDRINQKTEADLIVDALREELKTRPDITIQLWIDGQDIMSDESLGYCRVYLSEIQKASKFKKTLLTEDNRKFQFDTREATFTKKFESGLFNVGHIQITFQLFFAPDLPDELDLSEFCEIPPEFYPYQIQEQLRVGKDHEDNEEFKTWDNDIRLNFQNIGLERTAYNIFFKNIFVRDQFNYYHLVSKFIEKFYIKFQSQEATRELFADPLDIKLSNLYEMAHFVRNIPFIQDSFSKNDIWRSPDFLLKIRKGFIHDHAVLAACLFMGYEEEDKLRGAEKNYIPMEHRVFVCLGTLKHNKAYHAWVMTYSYDLSSVTMWDVQEDFNLVMQGRVKSTQIGDLRRFLYPEKQPVKKDNGLMGGFGNMVKGKPEKKISKRQQRKEEKMKKVQERLKKEQERLELVRQREKDNRKEEDALIMKQRQNAKFNVEDVDNVEEEQIDWRKFENKGGTVKIKNERQMGIQTMDQRGTILTSTDKQTAKATVKGEKQSVKPMFQNPYLNKFREDNKDKQTPIQAREAKEEEIRKKNPIAKFSKREQFKDKEKKDVVDVGMLPYASVEILFNQKNIYGNLGNQNPQDIFYHLHKKSEWLPFIIENQPVKEEEEEIEEDEEEEFSDEDEDQLQDDMKNELQDFKKVTWNRKLGAFYSAPIMKEPIKKNRIKRLLEDIFMEVYAGVEKARGKYGLYTKWKHEADGLNKKMMQYLKILEYKTTQRPIKIVEKREGQEHEWNSIFDCSEYDYIISEWQKEVKLLLPLNYHYCALPMRFTYTESEKIRSVIVENMASFFMRREKKIIFNLAGKIFNYPNRVNCVRLILGFTYTQAVEDVQNKDQDEDDEDDNQEQQEGIQVIDVEKPILDNIDEEEEDENDQLLNANRQQLNSQN